MSKNWQTNVAGVSAILTGVCSFITAILDGDVATEPNWTAIAASIVLGIGLLRAKDASSPN